MQCTERPRDTERGDGSTSATGERTSSLWLPRLQHAVRALRPNRETDSERSPDWHSITRAPRTGFLRPFLTKARARQTSVHREILIRPMTAVGHERRTRSGSGGGACLLRSESDRITASPRMDATCHKRLGAIAAKQRSLDHRARSNRPAATSWPIAFASCRLTTNSNLVGWSTGRSAGFAPRSQNQTHAPYR
jgi:hypothetical protein